MYKISGKLTVYFENPFWVAVFEHIEDGLLSVSKVTLGAEPKDYEIYEFVLNRYNKLQFSSVVAAVIKEEKKNHKRVQRELRKQAKEMLLVDDVDNKEYLTGLFNSMYDELPAPKPKKKK